MPTSVTDQAMTAAPSVGASPRLGRLWFDEWTAWLMDSHKQGQHTEISLNDVDEILTPKLSDKTGSLQRSSGWESWEAILPTEENQLLMALVPIPLSMIMLFLAISWYRRRKSSDRRRRERRRRRHLMELNLIRRHLSSQSGLGQPLVNPQPARDPGQGTTVYNPPPYVEALDTRLYPLVSVAAGSEEPPAYSQIAERLRHCERIQMSKQRETDAPCIHPGYDITASVSGRIREEAPPSYSEIFPELKNL